ncbi:hypothetical protein [Fulvitalea axinellae]
MKKVTQQVLRWGMIVALVMTFACGSDNDDDSDPKRTSFGIFTMTADGKTAKMDGEINSKSLENYEAMAKDYPDVNKIQIVNCNGSSDDETNLKLSKKVHQKGISTELLDNGTIASGGVDFFLAGVKRSIGANTKIGVHSWGGTDGNGNSVSASDFPKGHANHQPYIDYYMSIGFSQADAEEFYYFTINAAPASGMHWMTAEEIAKYKMEKK